MAECRNHDAFCNAAGSGFGPFCSAPSDGSSVPPMRMYFHTGTYDIILFRGWVPVTGWQYALSCLAILAMGVVVQGMRVSWPQLPSSCLSQTSNCLAVGRGGAGHAVEQAKLPSSRL